MKIFNNPLKESWPQITKRPEIKSEDLEPKVQQILTSVKSKGDAALKDFALKFDQVELQNLKVSEKELKEAEIEPELKAALEIAKNNITKFHQAQKSTEPPIETMSGITCWRKAVPIEKVGLYIPGGSAPLFSTLLMLGIPAKIAGCKQIIVCTPTDKNGKVNSVVLYTAKLLGLSEIYKIGGAQAIAAMAFGTRSVPKVNKIFGPGNQYVMKAKDFVQKEGIAIDLPAGPSEVLVIADKTSDPDFVAADLLSQAEHGPDSQVVLLTTDDQLQQKVQFAISEQLEQLPRKAIAAKALENSLSVLLNSIEDCVAFSNFYAPEHLILAIDKAEDFVDQIQNAGSVFLGNYSCESAGDYASGTNHTLPTNGYARSYSGVSLDSFIKNITFQKLSREGILNLGETIEVMAEAEQLQAHKNAVSIRLKKIQNEL